jgi:hypothetical protein
MNYLYWQEVFENIQASSPEAAGPLKFVIFLLTSAFPG